uniref:Uncharacterized protein n=1 Tax=Avena sativa TaxID=4498 RepID=A0ACD5UD09_AVESA
MDPYDSLNVHFHFGGQFVRIGPELQYVGGDEAMSEIARANLSLLELKAHLREHMNVKASMKYYFLLPGEDLADGLLFLNDDIGCKRMSDDTVDGGVAEVFVEYHGEEDEEEDSEKSESDFEDEFGSEDDKEDNDFSEPEVVLISDAIGENYILDVDKIEVNKTAIYNALKQNMKRSSTSHI